MAKVEFGMIITDMVNKLGGDVIQSNHYGRFMRTKVVPFNAQTIYQQSARNNFLAVKAAWEALNNDQRARWNAATGDFPRIDAFGNTYYQTGSNLFQWLNMNMQTCGLGLFTIPPSPDIPANDLTFTPAFNQLTTNTYFDFAHYPNDSNIYLFLYMTRGLSAGITYVSTEYRLLETQISNNGNPVNEYLNWLFRFPVALAGTKIFFKAEAMSVLSGQKGVSYSKSIIVA